MRRPVASVTDVASTEATLDDVRISTPSCSSRPLV